MNFTTSSYTYVFLEQSLDLVTFLEFKPIFLGK